MRDHKITEFFETCLNNLLKKSSIIKNPIYLTDTWIPEHIIHRENELAKTLQLISPLLKHQKPLNILYYGPTGTGKTLSAKYLIKQLEKLRIMHNYPIRCAYINCRFYGSKSSVFHSILRELFTQISGKFVKDGIKNYELIELLVNYIKEKNLKILAVFDEIDNLIKNSKEDDFLYLITRVDHVLGEDCFCFIGISNSLDYINRLDARTTSSLNAVKLKFKPYDAKQLYDILYQRAIKALDENSFNTEVLSYISAWVAKESGDARKAISILRLSANLADLDNSKKITLDHVNRAIEGYDLDAFISMVETLTTHFKLIVLSMLKLQKESPPDSFLDIAEIYSLYVQLCDEYGFKPLSRDNFNKKIKQLETFLGDYLETYVKSFGRDGRKKLVKLLLDSSKAEKVIKLIESQI